MFLKLPRNFRVILCLFYCERVSEEILQAEHSLVMSLNGIMYLRGTASLENENKPHQEKVSYINVADVDKTLPSSCKHTKSPWSICSFPKIHIVFSMLK